MTKILSNDELKNELRADYSSKTINRKSLEIRMKNILAFNEISRNGLKHGNKEKRILLYETLCKEKVYIQLPGKEANEKPEMPLDFRPKIQLENGTIVSDLSFGAIWDILDSIGKEHKAYLSYVATIFFRLGYMVDYLEADEDYKSYEISYQRGREQVSVGKDSIHLNWYRLNLSNDIWYTLNDRIGYIKLEDGNEISFEGFVKLVDLLFQNEDCKYYYKNVVLNGKSDYKLKHGRNNSSAANLLIINYLEGHVKLSRLLDSFQKSRGVPRFNKSDYSIVTDGMILNLDVEN